MTGNGISVAATEKKRRGRPALWTDEQLEADVDDWDCPSRRTMQNRMYAETAERILRHSEQAFDWRYLGHSVLVELGRFEDAEEIISLASQISREGLKAKHAAACLRRHRLSKKAGK